MSIIEKRKNKFISDSVSIHGNKYDYSMVNYVDAKTNVKIICPEHGVFEQVPDSHRRNHGCSYCKGGKKSNTKDFIISSNKIHNSKYDYSLVHYINNVTKVKIKCYKHGVFEQKPQEHIAGNGCKSCGLDTITLKKTLSLEKFINKANNVHNEKYDYSLIKEFKGTRLKVKIICSKHGEFNQLANSHLSGAGCPVCNSSQGEQKIKNFLDNNNIEYVSQKKFIDCRNILPLPFDFYLPILNLCIEFDGIQHFKQMRNYKKTENLEFRKFKDNIKTNYCTGENGRPNLLRINYKQIYKVDKILKQTLSL